MAALRPRARLGLRPPGDHLRPASPAPARRPDPPPSPIPIRLVSPWCQSKALRLAQMPWPPRRGRPRNQTPGVRITALSDSGSQIRGGVGEGVMWRRRCRRRRGAHHVCAGGGGAPRQARTREPPLPSVPPLCRDTLGPPEFLDKTLVFRNQCRRLKEEHPSQIFWWWGGGRLTLFPSVRLLSAEGIPLMGPWG